MKSPLLFILLEHFADEDFSRFDRYLKSPFYAGYLKLYSDILRIINKNRILLINRRHKDLRDIILRGISCSEKTALSLISRLGNLAIEYMKTKASESRKYESEYFLCEHMLDTGNFVLLDERIQTCMNILETEDIDEDLYLNLYKMDYLNYRASMITNSKLYGEDAVSEQQKHTLEASKNLFVYTLTRFTIMHANYVILNIDSSCKNSSPYPVLIKPMLDILNKAEFKSYGKRRQELITLYKHFYLMFSDLYDNESYFRYKKQFMKIKYLFSSTFAKSHFNVMMNYCNLRTRLNDKEGVFYEESLNVTNEYIHQKMYISEFSKYLSPVIFRNYIIKCNTPKHIKRLDRFIKEHKGSLHKDHVTEMNMFARAFYLYLNKQYGKALKNIINLNRTQFVYKYDIRNLELKIYFDTNRIENMESILHNYYTNIKKEAMFSKDVKDKYYMMLDYFRELIKTTEKYNNTRDIKEYEYLLLKIRKEPGFVMKDWIVSKINEIVENHNAVYKAPKAQNKV